MFVINPSPNLDNLKFNIVNNVAILRCILFSCSTLYNFHEKCCDGINLQQQPWSSLNLTILLS